MRFQRHVMFRFCRYFFALSLLALLLLTLERMVRVIQLVVDKNQSVLSVLELTSTLIPHYVAISLPLAFVICIIVIVYQLSLSQEIIALQSAGASNFQIARPFFILSLILVCVSFVIIGYVKPLGRYGYATLVGDLNSSEIFFIARDGVFLESSSNVFMLENISADRQSFGRVFAYRKLPNGFSVTTAKRGFVGFRDGNNDGTTLVHLEKGLTLNLQQNSFQFDLSKDNASSFNDTQQLLNFEWLYTTLGDNVKKAPYVRGGDVIELYIHELFAKIFSYFDVTSSEQIDRDDYLLYIGELGHRLQSILIFPALVLLVFPLSLVNSRRPRYFGMVLSMIAFVFFQKLTDSSRSLVISGTYSPWVLQVGLFGLFTLISFSIFAYSNYMISGFFSSYWKRFCATKFTRGSR